MKENWHTEYQGDLVVNKLQLRSIEHFKIPFLVINYYLIIKITKII